MARGPRLVLLAAGASARLGEPKALARLDAGEGAPRTPLALLLAAGAALGDPRPLVVAGPDHEAIARALPPGVELARNERWQAGRTGSAALAAARRAGCDLCLAPVDAPLVPAAVFAALRDAWSAAGAPASGWLAPACPGPDGRPRHGHPIVLGRSLAAELEGLSPDRPLRALRARARPLLSVAVASEAILDDLDTPEDLRALRDRLAGGKGLQRPGAEDR